MTVSGLTITSAERHWLHIRDSQTHSKRSAAVSGNRDARVRCSTSSWWRKATFSSWSAARERIQHERLWRSERRTAFIAKKRIGGRP
jgi:hypothetical protein